MKITPDLINKYLNNACSADERKAVDEWYKNFDNQADPLRLMNEAEQDSLKRTMYHRFKDSIAEKLQADGHRSFNHKIYALLFTVGGIAALMMLIFKLGISTPSFNKASSETIPQIAFQNASFSIHKKVLPDGSTVWISPNSTLTYPKKFTGRFRRVSLVGEAFFEVTKNKAHPFIISSNELTTKVWGTSFRVKSYKNIPAEVSVVTGKVSVNRNQQKNGIMLLPGQRAKLIGHQKLIKDVSPAVKNEMRIWKKVSLSFNNSKLGDVFTALNQNFGINIYSNDARLNSLVFTGDFSNQSLPAILDMIEESVNANYSIENGSAYIFKTNSPL